MGVYRISDDAAADLTELTDGMVERGANLDSADRFIDGLLKSFQDLADFPEVGTSRDYLPAEVLAFPHRNQMIFYRKTAEGIEIARVLYGGIDLTRYFGA